MKKVSNILNLPHLIMVIQVFTFKNVKEVLLLSEIC